MGKKTKHMEALDSNSGKKNNIWVDGSYGYRSFFPLICPGLWLVDGSFRHLVNSPVSGNGSYFSRYLPRFWDTSQQWLALGFLKHQQYGSSKPKTWGI